MGFFDKIKEKGEENNWPHENQQSQIDFEFGEEEEKRDDESKCHITCSYDTTFDKFLLGIAHPRLP